MENILVEKKIGGKIFFVQSILYYNLYIWADVWVEAGGEGGTTR